MSRLDDPSGRKPLPGIVERPRGVHHEGQLLGLQYELGIRFSDLAPPDPAPPLPSDAARPGPPAALPEGERAGPAPAEAIGRWESEGGSAPPDDDGSPGG